MRRPLVRHIGCNTRRRIEEIGEAREIQREEEAIRPVDEEESESMVIGVENFILEMVVTEEGLAEGLKAALGVEIEKEGESEGKEGGYGTLSLLGAL